MSRDDMLKKNYQPNGEIVAREIEDEFLLVPVKAGEGTIEEALYALNHSGRAIWEKLDGSRSIQTIIDELADEYDADVPVIQEDVMGLVEALLETNLLVEKA